MKTFIYFKHSGENFRLFIDESGALPKQSFEDFKYFKPEFQEFSFYWSENDYHLPLEGQWMSLEDLPALEENQGAFLCQALGCFWEFMPGSAKGLKTNILPRKFSLKIEDKNEITFFGGSFFPWHEGHRECTDQASKHGRNVIVVPDHNPWKEQGRKSCYWASYKQICNKLAQTNYSIFPGFWGRNEGNPTVTWLPFVELKEKSLLMGDDSFFGLHIWKDVEILLAALDSVYVVPREGKTKQREVQKELLQKFNPGLKFYFLDKHPYEGISSTEIRKTWS